MELLLRHDAEQRDLGLADERPAQRQWNSEWNSEQGQVHPVVQARFNVGTSFGGIVDIPPVTVRGDQVFGDYAPDYAAFFHSPSLLPPYPVDVDVIDPEGDIPILSPTARLRYHSDFNQLPERMQDMVLASPTMTAQMIRFFEAGGSIQFVSGLGNFGGEYTVDGAGNPLIRLDDSIILAKDAAGDSYEYLNSVWISTLAHEVGHWVLGVESWSGGSLADYIDHRAISEALATVNSMVVAAEIEYLSDFSVTMMGYATDSQLRPIYEAFQADHDLDALVAQISDLVKGKQSFIDDVTEFWEEWYGP